MKKILSHFLLLGMVVSGSALAVKTGEFSVAASNPPHPNASENTVVVIPPSPGPVTGALDADDSTYDRLIGGSCAAVSGVGTAVSYDTVTINNTGSSIANVTAFTSDQGNSAACTSGDTVIAAYSSFDPNNAATGCLVSDDDGGTSPCSHINFQIAAGQSATIVVASYDNGAQFPYQLNFTGTTPVQLQKFSVD